jgi:cytochrome c
MLSNTHPNVIQSNRRYLDVLGVSPYDDAVIHAWQGTNGDNQEWKAIVQANGSVKLKARHSGKCLQYNGNVLVQSACVQRYDENQQFVINSIGYANNGGYDTNPDLGN